MKITKHLLPISKIKFDDFSLRIQNKTDKERFSVILLLKYFRYQPRELEHYSGSNAPGYKQDNEIIVTIWNKLDHLLQRPHHVTSYVQQSKWREYIFKLMRMTKVYALKVTLFRNLSTTVVWLSER